MKPTFTIITTTYNCGSKIGPSLESVITQSFQNFEYLIIDGKSNDGTRERLAAIKDPRIRIYSEPDEGIYDAMNKGVALARGRYLCFLGAGDTLFPGVLEEISRCLPDRDNTLIYGNVVMDATGNIYDGRFSKLKLCCRNICHQGIFYGREIFNLAGNYNLKYRILADWAFNLKCFGDGRVAIQYVPIRIATFEGGGVSGSGDPAFQADRMSLIQDCLGKTAYVRYRIYIWKEQLVAKPKNTLKHFIPPVILAARRKLLQQLSGRR